MTHEYMQLTLNVKKGRRLPKYGVLSLKQMTTKVNHDDISVVWIPRRDWFGFFKFVRDLDPRESHAKFGYWLAFLTSSELPLWEMGCTMTLQGSPPPTG